MSSQTVSTGSKGRVCTLFPYTTEWRIRGEEEEARLATRKRQKPFEQYRQKRTKYNVRNRKRIRGRSNFALSCLRIPYQFHVASSTCFHICIISTLIKKHIMYPNPHHCHWAAPSSDQKSSVKGITDKSSQRIITLYCNSPQLYWGFYLSVLVHSYHACQCNFQLQKADQKQRWKETEY